LGLGTSDLTKSRENPESIGIFEKLFGWIGSVPRYAYAVGGSSLILILSFFGVRFYNTTYQIILAEDLLKENYKVYYSDSPRLSGGYASTGIIQVMGDEADENYLDKALDYTKIAENNKYSSSAIMEIKAQIYIMKKEFNQADKILNQLNKGPNKRAETLNDQGVLMYYQGNYDAASQLFTQAIKEDRAFAEGYYNLALVQEKLGDHKSALKTMTLFQSLEQDSIWQKAAESFLNSKD
jgi:tetratricopeptide (TPR) repeat protein